MGHVASLTGSLVLSFVPIVLFGFVMPETLGHRGKEKKKIQIEEVNNGGQVV